MYNRLETEDISMASDVSSDDDQEFETLVVKTPTFINAKAQMKKFDTVVETNFTI